MMLDQPWKIASVVATLFALRIAWGLWTAAPHRKGMIELLDSGLIAFVLVFLVIRPFVVQAFFIPSESMVPNLMKGDRILVNKFVYHLNGPQRGDIIVFDAPPQAVMGNGHQDFVKRLIGLPGDRVQIKAGDGVYVNDRPVEEPPGVDVPDYDWPAGMVGITGSDVYAVPAGCYFVLGDNRNNSRDSHMWRDADGRAAPELDAKRMRGKAMAIFWPPARLRLLGDHRLLRLR
jgi:signal peptidase I